MAVAAAAVAAVAAVVLVAVVVGGVFRIFVVVAVLVVAVVCYGHRARPGAPGRLGRVIGRRGARRCNGRSFAVWGSTQLLSKVLGGRVGAQVLFRSTSHIKPSIDTADCGKGLCSSA